MSNLDLAWLAGFFDGEGCVFIDRPDRKHRQTLRVQVTNTIPSSLLGFESRWGGKLRTRSNGERRKPIWIWAAYAGDAQRCLIDLLPYLRVKAAQAEIGIRFQELKSGDNNMTALKGTHPRREEIYAGRKAAFVELRALNERGERHF